MIGLALWLAMAAQTGVPAVDPAVTASKSLSAPRAAAPMNDTCDEPVLLVISGPDQMDGYRKAIVASGLYQTLGGYELNSPVALDLLAGASGKLAQLIVRFPCRANADAFWANAAQQAQFKFLLRNPQGVVITAAIYPEAPLRADMVGKVGDDSYSVSFDAAAVPQSNGR